MAKLKMFGEKGFFTRTAGRNLIIVLCVLVLGAAVYLNYLYFFDGNKLNYGDEGSAGDTNTDVTPPADDTDTVSAYFTSASLSRKEARDEAIAVLQTVVSNADALEETKNDALAEISRIALDIEKERNIETMIKGKGFEDCIAVLSADNANIIVRQESELLQNQIAQIKEIVYKEASILPSNIRIIRK